MMIIWSASELQDSHLLRSTTLEWVALLAVQNSTNGSWSFVGVSPKYNQLRSAVKKWNGDFFPKNAKDPVFAHFFL